MNTEEYIINYNNTELKGDLLFYIDYARKIKCLRWIEIRECENELSIYVSNSPLIYNDDYKFNVIFDSYGKFKHGYSSFYNNKIRLTSDQNKFKQQIKREIMRLNNMQGIIQKMLR